MTATEEITFDIRNFAEQLIPAKEKGKYICPVCNGNDLGVDPDTGAYNCFNGCECKDIREALKPWVEVIAERRQRGTKTYRASGFKKTETKSSGHGQKKKWEPVPLPEGELALARLAEVPSDIPQAVKAPATSVSKNMREKFRAKGATNEELQEITLTTYDYGEKKTVYRYQCPVAAIEKKYEKTFLISRVDDSGQMQWDKGAYAWQAYRQAEAIAALKAIEGKTPILLVHEGEKCVETARGERLAGITVRGAAFDVEDLVCILNDFKGQVKQTFIIAYCQDNDEAGKKKANSLGDACARSKVPFVLIDLTAIKSDLNPKSDIADIIACGEMDGDQLAAALLEQIELIRFEQQNAGYENEDEEEDESVGEEETSTGDKERFYRSAAKNLGLPFEDCVTAVAFDTWVYHRITNATTWRVIDSAFYRWSEITESWEHQTDAYVAALIADAGEKAYKLTDSEKHGWMVSYPYGSNKHKDSAFKYIRSRLERPEPLPFNGHLLSFRNCTVDLRTGEQMPHSKEHFLTNSIPVDYEPNKPCPEVFRRFVNESYGDEMLDIIRAFTGAFLDPTAPYGRFPHLIGQSGGGKGALQRFWSSLLGEDGSGESSYFADLATPEGRHQHLTGKKIFAFPDMGGHQSGIRAFYELVDNGKMSGRALFNSTAYSKRWFTRFCVCSVDHLQIENTGDGWMRRAYPIPLRSRSVKQNPALEPQLQAAKADIISWALAMPREERDKILLSPPATERSANAALDAALYGDSTRSFVDLCLRPTTDDAVQMPSYLLHDLYVAYCREHGYQPLGMTKFISHLKTVLPRNFVDRQWSVMVDGHRERIPAHWRNIVSLPSAFMSWTPGGDTSGENSGPPVKEELVCLKRGCHEGGMEMIQDFWTPPSEPSPEPSTEPTSSETVSSEVVPSEDTPSLSKEEIDAYLDAIAEGVGIAADSLEEAHEIVAESYTPVYAKIFLSLEDFKKEIKRRIRLMGYAERIKSLGSTTIEAST